jgi:hypothetical protein
MKGEQLEFFSNENQEEKRFLQDIPDWEKKLKRYEFDQFVKENTKPGNLLAYYPEQAEFQVKEINEKYGEGSAQYMVTNDGSRTAYKIVLKNRPYITEFKDILDEQGNLLPRRTANAA